MRYLDLTVRAQALGGGAAGAEGEAGPWQGRHCVQGMGSGAAGAAQRHLSMRPFSPAHAKRGQVSHLPKHPFSPACAKRGPVVASEQAPLQ
jgi:hypothetical protein